MSHIRLFLIAMLTNVILFGDGRTIPDRSFVFDVKNVTAKPEESLVIKSFDSETIEIERLKSKTMVRNNCTENCSEKDRDTLNRSNPLNESCPYESKELCIIFSVSKIAKVRVATTRPMKSVFVGLLNSTESLQVDRRVKQSEKSSFDSARHNEDNFQNSSRKQTKPPNVHCRATRDVYIPEVRRSLPAFACKFGNNTFVLSSTRFLEDRRSYLDINIDEDIFKNVKPSPKISRSNELNLLPALLVLNAASDDYRIQMRESTVDERKVNQTRGSR